MIRLGLGIDPGASTCIALVEVETGHAARLLGSWEVHTSSPGLAGWTRWVHRLHFALELARGAILEARPRADAERLWVEETSGQAAKGTRAGHSLPHLHQRIGAVRATAILVGLDEIEPVEQRSWTRMLGVHVRSRKMGDGAHRLSEARFLVRGASEALDACTSADRRVDLAESILIATAAALSVSIMSSPTARPQPLPAGDAGPAG